LLISAVELLLQDALGIPDKSTIQDVMRVLVVNGQFATVIADGYALGRGPAILAKILGRKERPPTSHTLSDEESIDLDKAEIEIQEALDKMRQAQNKTRPVTPKARN
jgi:hypothetical protein